MPDPSVVEMAPELGPPALHPGPDTISKLVARIRAMANRLLPVEVELDAISDATSSIITPEVVSAFRKAGGDFEEAVPFCLLRARQMFKREGYLNPTDFEETLCRATACEVIARRMLRTFHGARLQNVMSTRFRYRESDGDASAPTSALEIAIDQHCTIFLSCNESQQVVNALWSGEWVQQNNEDDDIDYVDYHISPDRAGSFWSHLDPDRLCVPRYQSLFRVIIWLLYLLIYSQSVLSPLDGWDSQRSFDGWEVALYTMTFAFFIEEMVKVIKTFRLATSFVSSINFWTVVNFLTDTLLITAFALRVAGMRLNLSTDDSMKLHKLSFQVLSCAAPLIWMKLITVFEAYQTVGVLEVVVFRMLRESVIFFILLGVMGIGFAQALYALDAADGQTGEDNPGDKPGGGDDDGDGGGGFVVLINNLIQALLGAADFGPATENFGYPFGLIIYYSWNFLTTIILVNVLIALFGSAYQEISDNAVDEYLAFFAGKTIDMIRAPDQYVYPAPFNLIETFLIAPFEFFLTKEQYRKLNRFWMTTIFFIPLCMIAFFESQVVHGRRGGMLHDYFAEPMPEDDEDPKIINPESDDPAGTISKVDFDTLIRVFPNTTVTESTVILREIDRMRKNLDDMEKKMGQ